MKALPSSRDALRRLVWYWAPLLGWMAAIFAVSSLTPATIDRVSSPVQGLPVLTKSEVAHFVEFGVLAALAYRLVVSRQILAAPLLWVAVIFFTMGYAVTDELHQSFVPGRDPSLMDLVYDGLGGLVGLAAAELAARVRRRGRRPN